MEKAIIKNLQSMLPSIMALTKKKEAISFDYDKEADVLYVSLRKPQQATNTEMISDDMLLRKRNGELVGITLLHASKYQ